MSRVAYAELQVLSNFSFLEGASHADELVLQAKALGLAALGIADRNSLAGVVRAHVAAKTHGLRLLVGARLDFSDGGSLIAYPIDRPAYARLSRLITLGRRRADKGQADIRLADLPDYAEGLILIALPGLDGARDRALARRLVRLKRMAGDRLYLAAAWRFDGQDQERLDGLAALAERMGIALLATNDVIAHAPGRRALADVLTCIREKTSIDSAGRLLERNAERHLKPPQEMARLFAPWPVAIARTMEIAERVTFSLDELAYEYPDEIVEPGKTPQQSLEDMTWAGARWRYPAGIPDKVRTAIEHELCLIGQLNYAPYFLTVQELVRFAKDNGILHQGRGSAANSTICYCLDITAVDPMLVNLLFERFVSAERGEPPDIDVDFEHERREEVIQHIYQTYGRDRAGLAATVISYRTRGAIRDVGKALGLSEDVTALISSQIWGWSSEGVAPERLAEIGLDPQDERLRLAIILVGELMGFPRHLSQHVGGFVITRGRLDELCPIENAAMADRTVLEWDKDDLDALGILKIDVLALGMLTCIHKAFDLLRSHYGRDYTLANLPKEDLTVYDMLCRADSIGVFQVESRAQMAFLPRMRPREFYDLVIEVAIVRPGPIQGNMVHPYLRRRSGAEKPDYPSEALREVLHRTLGVPLFQEQAMKIAIVAAGFSPAEADKLRRSMAAFRRTGVIHQFREKMITGMLQNGYTAEFAERCFRQIEGFGEYGFPESHAASFALLVYVSAWLKRYYPTVFTAALLNSQPMGFYAPAQLVRDAAEHGVEIRPPDINRSDWDCTLEPGVTGYALRLGLRQVKGLRQEDGEWIAAARGNGYATVEDLWRRAGLGRRALEALADADAFGSTEIGRRGALWAVKGLTGDRPLPLFATMGEEPEPLRDFSALLPRATAGEEVVADYASIRLSLKDHPLRLLRPALGPTIVPAGQLVEMKNGSTVTAAGLVLVRQRPGSAAGVIFMTLEDETGVCNVVVWTDKFEAYRRTVLQGRLVAVKGRLQREKIVTHLIAEEIIDHSGLLDALAAGHEFGAEPQREPMPAPEGARKPAPAVARPRHPRDQHRALFPRSRDFH